MITGESTQTAPIFTLSSEILHDIVLANTYRDNSRGAHIFFSGERPVLSLSPLTNTRNASQVCRTWRDVILQSPLIWARCIDLNVLDQRLDNWRELVLQRAGDLMLSVTAVSAHRMMTPGGNIETFLADLLDKQWARISEIDVTLDGGDLQDARITEPFSRPAEKLRMFALRGPPQTWSPVDLHLLGGHAPELVSFSAPGYVHMKIDLKSPFMFTSNMRHLQLENRDQLHAADLLAACMRMPLLETLTLSITKLIHGDATVRSSSAPQLTMTKLKTIDVTTLSLAIYPAFIDRIKPAVGCALRATHYIDETECAELMINGSLECMAKVLSTCLNSYLVHHGKQSPLIGSGLFIFSSSFEFSCHEELFSIFVLCTRTAPPPPDYIPTLPHFIKSRLLDVVSTTNFPPTFSQLTLTVNPQWPSLDANVSQFFPNLVRTLRSMHWATTLVLHTPDPTTLSEILAIGALFPSLKALVISQPDDPSSLHIRDQVIPFLLERRAVAPIEVLDLERIGSELSVTVDDLKALDSINGLTVVWKMNGRSHRYECGIGGAEQIFEGSHTD